MKRGGELMAAGARAGTVRPVKERRKEARWGYGFIAIWFVGFAVFTAVPLAMSVYISFTSWSPIAGPFWEAHTVGFSNYGTFLHDHRYWHSIFNTIYFSFGSVLVVNVVSIPLALLLNQKLKGINLYRTIFYLPAIMPAVASVLIFRLIFLPGTGLVSWVLSYLHLQCNVNQLTCNPVDFLNDPKITMLVVILISAWGVGQTLLIYLAGLQGIETSYYEASSIDGAGRFQQFRSITLPLLTPAIFFNVVVGLIGAFQEFAKLVIYAGGSQATGGPADSLLTTFWYLYIVGFDFAHMGLASAMAFGLFALIMIVTLLNFWGQKKWVFYQEERR
jgi:multiple sugar transport system permease protein